VARYPDALTSSIFLSLPNIRCTAYKMSTKKKQQSMQKLSIQMSGAPGSGKSTVSRLLRRSIGDTVVFDHDVLRSSLLGYLSYKNIESLSLCSQSEATPHAQPLR
jgi:adenylylsulfate kinase-like enzyme